MSNRHGAFWTESPTSLQPMRESETVPYVIGSAPKGPVNEPILLTSYDESVDIFGEEPEDTLCESADVFFRRYRVGPVVFTRVEIAEEQELRGATLRTNQADQSRLGHRNPGDRPGRQGLFTLSKGSWYAGYARCFSNS